MPFQPPPVARSETHSSEGTRARSLRSAATIPESEQAASAVSATSTEIGDETRDALRRLTQLIRQQAQTRIDPAESEAVDSVARQVMEGRDAQAASDRARFLSEELQMRWRHQRGIARYRSNQISPQRRRKAMRSSDSSLLSSDPLAELSPSVETKVLSFEGQVEIQPDMESVSSERLSDSETRQNLSVQVTESQAVARQFYRAA